MSGRARRQFAPAPPTAQPPQRSSKRHRCPTGKHPSPHRGCYTLHGCRCAGCRALNRESSRASIEYRRWREGREMEGFTDAGPTRARLLILREQGLTQSQIASRVGLTQSSVSLLLNGQKRVRRFTAAQVGDAVDRFLREKGRLDDRMDPLP